MDRSLTVSEARDNLAEVIGRVQFGGERVTIARRGKPVAVVVSVEDAALLDEIEDRALAALAMERLAEYERTGESYPLAQVIAELGEGDGNDDGE
jgi:prevent-host-death family protein